MGVLRGWKFPIDVDETTGRIKTIEDGDNVRQSIKIILQTEQAERKMRPYFGSRLNRFMFQTVDLSLVSSISKEVNRAVKMWEKHVKTMNVDVIPSRKDASKVITNISFVTDFSPLEEKMTNVMNMNDLND